MAAETVGERLAGGRPSRFSAFLVAGMVANGSGVLTYRLLRGGEPTEKVD